MAIIRNFRLPEGIGVSADYIETYGVIESTDASTGSIVARGGMGIAKDAHIGGFLHLFSNQNASSGSTAALIVDGGIGVSKNIFLGGSVVSGSWAGNAVTARYGGTGYTTYTKGDLLVGVGSTFIRVGTGLSHQVLSPIASAPSGVGWTDTSLSSSISTCYGAFYSTQTQQVYGANTITPITLNNTYEAANVQIYGGAGTSSRIQINSTGVFNIQFSAQINLASGTQPQEGDFWFRINGSDVPFSNTKMSINAKDFHSLIALNFVSTFSSGQYFEIMMSSSDLNFLLQGIGSTTGPVRPATPSMIVSVTKVL
jgi:hypothetical protein